MTASNGSRGSANDRRISDLPLDVFEKLVSLPRAAACAIDAATLRQQILSKLQSTAVDGGGSIATVRDVLKIAPLALVRILDPLLTYPECHRLLSRIHRACAAKPLTALEMIQRTQTACRGMPTVSVGKIPTGLQTLDGCLQGGISVGSVAEVVGRAGVGKTHLAQQLCVLAAKSGGGAVYIDAEKKLSLTRLKEIALETALSDQGYMEREQHAHEFADQARENILVYPVLTTQELLERLNQLVDEFVRWNAAGRPPIRLVVIDSIAAPLRRDFDMMSSSPNTAAKRASAIFQIAKKLKQLAYDHQLAVMVVNQVGSGAGSARYDSQRNNTLDIGDGEFTASLGTAWQHCVSTRIVLDQEEDPHRLQQGGTGIGSSARTATLAKSLGSQRRNFPFELTKRGLCESNAQRHHHLHLSMHDACTCTFTVPLIHVAPLRAFATMKVVLLLTVLAAAVVAPIDGFAPPRLPKVSTGMLSKTPSPLARPLGGNTSIKSTAASAIEMPSIQSHRSLNSLQSKLVRALMMAYIASMCVALPVTLFPVWLLYKAKLIDRVQKERWSLNVGQFCSRWLMRLFPFASKRVIVDADDESRKNPQPSLWVCNHISMLDVFFVLALDKKMRGENRRPIKILYWKGLEANPITALLFKMCGFIPVAMEDNGNGNANAYDPKSFKQMLKSVKQAIDEGFDIGILPEGQPNPTPEKGLQPVFSGAFTLARMSRRPIQILALYGIHNLWHPDDTIGMHCIARDTAVRVYPGGRNYKDAEEFTTTFETVAGHFGAHGEDLPESELKMWLNGSMWETELSRREATRMAAEDVEEEGESSEAAGSETAEKATEATKQ
ncbi:hypothetical protein ACHAXT_000457 [Thalassiosira profunda]